MSCSMTTTVRSPAEPAEQLAGGVAFVVAHPGDRLVEQQQLGVLHQQHADLQPLLLAVRQGAGQLVAHARSSPTVSSARGDLGRHRRAAAQQGQRAAARQPAAMSRFCSTVSSSKTVGGLEGAADAQPGDPVHLAAEQLVLAEA